MNRNGGAVLAREAGHLGGSGGMPPRKFLKFRVFLVHSGAILVLMN